MANVPHYWLVHDYFDKCDKQLILLNYKKTALSLIIPEMWQNIRDRLYTLIENGGTMLKTCTNWS